jgi:hypothetical protein
VRRVSVAAALLVVALLAVAVVGAVTGTTASRALPPAVTTAPVTAAELVCPRIDSGSSTTGGLTAIADVARALTPPSQSSGRVTATRLTDHRGRTSTLTLSPSAVVASRKGLIPSIAVKATGPIAASVVADQSALTSSGRYRALVGSQCVAPATDWWFAGGDGRVGYTDILQLANPAPTAAEVSLSMWSLKGPVPASPLESVRVPARSSISLSLASIAPDVPTIALHVHASSGAVSAALVDRRSSGLRAHGGDFMPPTSPPSRHAVVAGFPGGVGSRHLVLANPGSVAAMVGLRLVTASGAFVPSGGHNQVVVPPGHTRGVDLSQAFAGATGAVELASDQPVVAEGLSVVTAPSKLPDLMWLAAVPPLVGSAGVARGRAPDGGHTLLLLSAPAGAASVRLQTPTGGGSSISVPAGRSISVDVTAAVRPRAAGALSGPWPFTVTVSGASPVFGVRVLSFAGAHGPLITGEPLIALPSPTVLPVVRENPRVAIR